MVSWDRPRRGLDRVRRRNTEVYSTPDVEVDGERGRAGDSGSGDVREVMGSRLMGGSVDVC